MALDTNPPAPDNAPDADPARARTAVFLNGRFLDDLASARVSAFDAGFQHAVGLFETMVGGHAPATGEPWVHRLDEHPERLHRSATHLGLVQSLHLGALQEAVMATLERSKLPRARIRLTITGGDLNLLSQAAARAALGDDAAPQSAAPGNPPAHHDPTLLIVAQPATTYPRAMFERGVTARFADTRLSPFDPLAGHKTLNYWWRLRELQIASLAGAAESIVLGVTNHVLSGCVSNVFLVKNGEVVTPIAQGEEGRDSNTPDAGQDVGDLGATGASERRAGAKDRRGPVLPSPVLPGIVRQWAIDQCEVRGLKVRREMIAPAELLDADEVFLTNSSWGVLPVTRVERRAIGGAQGNSSPSPGAITRELVGAWRDETYLN